MSDVESPGRSMARAFAPAAVAVVLLLVATGVARRLGYKVGGTVIVRCRDGHLFTTLWVPGASLTSIRLGWWRWQRCPVGQHWTLVSPVRDTDLTDEERDVAAHPGDTRLP